MASTSGPILPTDNLVFMVDAANPRSFRAARPDRWYDIVGRLSLIHISEPTRPY